MMRTFLIITLILFVSCVEQKARTESIGRYSFDVPQEWVFTKYKGVDGYYGDITSKDGCSIKYGSSRYELTMPDSPNLEKYHITIDSVSDNFRKIIYVPKSDTGNVYLSAHNIDSTGDKGLETPSIQFVMTSIGCVKDYREQILSIFDSVRPRRF